MIYLVKRSREEHITQLQDYNNETGSSSFMSVDIPMDYDGVSGSLYSALYGGLFSHSGTGYSQTVTSDFNMSLYLDINKNWNEGYLLNRDSVPLEALLIGTIYSKCEHTHIFSSDEPVGVSGNGIQGVDPDLFITAGWASVVIDVYMYDPCCYPDFSPIVKILGGYPSSVQLDNLKEICRLLGASTANDENLKECDLMQVYLKRLVHILGGSPLDQPNDNLKSMCQLLGAKIDEESNFKDCELSKYYVKQIGKSLGVKENA